MEDDEDVDDEDVDDEDVDDDDVADEDVDDEDDEDVEIYSTSGVRMIPVEPYVVFVSSMVWPLTKARDADPCTL